MYTNVVCCCHFCGIFRNIATDVHDVGCVLDHINRKDGFYLLVYHIYVVFVVVDGVEFFSYVVDVVDVVVVAIFVRVAELVVPHRTDRSIDDDRFFVLLLLVIGFVMVSVSSC